MRLPWLRDAAPVQAPVRVGDGFANLIAGIGQANHKAQGNAYIVKPEDPFVIDSVYRSSAFFRKIVDTRPRDAVRRWRQWQADNADIELIEAEEKRLDVLGAVLKAITLRRKYGGSVIIALGLSGDNAQEARLDSLSRGALKRLVVLSRYDVQVEDIITDPLSEFYGQPSRYVINTDQGGRVEIHPSRVIALRPTITDVRQGVDTFWGDSLWQSLEDAITPVDSSSAIMADLMREAEIDVVRVPGLLDKVATEKGENAFIRRFHLVNTLKSISNAMLLDKDDEWDQKTINWTGIPEIVQTQMQIMAGAAGYPLTRLLGVQAKGLSNDGQADLRQYYDDVQQEQELDIGPAIRRLDEWIIRSATGGRDPSTWYQWRALWQLTAKEQAEVDKLQAETVEKIVNTGLIPTPVMQATLQARMIESGSWPAMEQAVEEFSNQAPPEDDLGRDDDASFADAAPRPLYVRRNVLNGADILEWAKGQGFKTTLTADDLHVTIAYSHAPVDWMAAGENWSGDEKGNLTVAAGGPRLMEQFGDARVLLFASSHLSWRHESIKNIGASWDHPEYQPHITISYDPDSPALTDIEPYRGQIVLGPEIFEAIDENWRGGIREA